MTRVVSLGVKLKRIVLGVLFVVTPIIGAAAVSEGLLRLVDPQDLTGTWETIGPRGLILNRARETSRHQLGERRVTYRFNSLHQRGAEPRPGVPKVLVLGNSFSMGWLVDEADSLPGRLQAFSDRELGKDRAQFLNAAVGGWGFASYLAYLEEFGEAIDPDAITLVIYLSDFGRAQRSGLYTLAGDGSLDLQAHDATNRQSPLRGLLGQYALYRWLLNHSHLVQVLRRKLLSLIVDLPDPVILVADKKVKSAKRSPTDPDARTRRLTHAILRRIKEWCAERNVRLYMVGYYSARYPGGIYDWLRPLARKEGVPFLDLQEPMSSLARSDLGRYAIKRDGHPTEEAIALAADRVWTWNGRRLVQDLP
ncbi:MAG: hypothetical protein QF830_02410 [Rhodospirillales bacterium]|nr:hypothetical protein [Rhodospirillales bacterium]MDP6882966.1 hypothetical protein [Rhodospirillales bacterium]